jgi:hypothetical protein
VAIDFSAAWPPVCARVTAVLRGRGVQAADIDDIVQDLAIRALRDPQRFTSTEHMVRWCCRVAINLHIDLTRRRRKLSPEPLEDTAAHHDVAAAVEGRLALDAVLMQMAGLSADDRRLLLHPTQADSRKEAVRLAVRRHRLRTRLAALLEGTLAGVAILRRALRRESGPARVLLVAVPVVAVLVTVPLVLRPRAGAGTPKATARNAVLDTGTRGERSVMSRPDAAPRVAGVGTVVAIPVQRRQLLGLGSHGMSVDVSQVKHPDEDPTFCAWGYVNLCVDRPGPSLPEPKLPLLPLAP